LLNKKLKKKFAFIFFLNIVPLQLFCTSIYVCSKFPYRMAKKKQNRKADDKKNREERTATVSPDKVEVE
jgi:hypothetical protein